MKIAVLCEFSGTVRDSFARNGHQAVSCDLLPTESDGPHIQDDCLNYDWSEYDLIIAHPPCTYLANSGVRWLHSDPDRWSLMEQACAFFKAILNLPVEHICIENPTMHSHAIDRIGTSYSQVIQPWQFGHKETKRTCLWLKNLPNLIPTNIVGPPPKDKEELKTWQRIHNLAPSEDRWKIRSITYQGIADAMAEQWGIFDEDD